LREEQEVWYGSATALSSFESSSGLAINIKHANTNLLVGLRRLLGPKPAPEKPNPYSSLTAYAMAWETFYSNVS
jgi:hypothetical protein